LKETLRSTRVLVFVAPFILMAPVWLAGKALYWGTPSTQFIPWWWQAWQSLQAGEWPLWNPLVGMGAPLMANYQSAIFYPPNWLYFGLAALGGLPWMAWGQAILLAAHLAWAGWGMLNLLKRLGLGELGQTVGALAFGMSGYLVARAHFLSINAAVAWLPWILLAAFELVQEPKSRRAVLKLALCLGLQWLAGHAQIAWYSLLFTIAWTAFWAWQQGSGRNFALVALRFAAAGAIAFGLAAVQLIPTAEYLLQSQRAAQVGSELAMTYSLWPWRLITLVAPNFFGNPAQGTAWGYGNYWEDAMYVGLLPLLIAVAMIFALRRVRENKSLIIFLSGAVLVSFVLALGKNTPIFPWLYEFVPTFDMFQGPTRFSLWAVFALAVLAALGVERWRRPMRRGLYWSRLAAAGAGAIALGAGLASMLGAAGRVEIEPTFIAASVSAAVVALGAAMLNLQAPQKKLGSAHWKWLVALLLAADLLYAGWGLNPGGTIDVYKEDAGLHAALREELGTGRLYLPAADEEVLKFDYLFQFADFDAEDPRGIRATLLPNIGILDGIASANNFDPLVPARYENWIAVLNDASAETQAAMLARMNVSVIETVIPNEGASVLFTPVATLPRARWVNCALGVEDGERALDLVRSGEYAAEEIVIIEGSMDELCGTGELGLVEIAASSANRVLVNANAPGGGWLVLADTFYPGWHAYANGNELPIYAADGLFRAVPLAAGESSIEFVYKPLSFNAGLVLSLVTWPAMLLFWRRERE
jgi:hypothetical protein